MATQGEDIRAGLESIAKALVLLANEIHNALEEFEGLQKKIMAPRPENLTSEQWAEQIKDLVHKVRAIDIYLENKNKENDTDD